MGTLVPVPNPAFRIAIVMPFHTSEGRGGGAEVQAWYLAKELDRRGLEVVYICQSVAGRAGTQGPVDAVTVMWVPYTHRFRWRNGRHYWKALERTDPNVVVQRGTSHVTGVIGRFCSEKGRRFVWICSDNESPRRWMNLRRFVTTMRARRRLRLRDGLHLANALICDLWRHRGMALVSETLTQNDEQRDILKREFGLSSGRVVSGHPLPEQEINAEARRRFQTVLWVANLGPGKRPELFVELARACLDTGLRFVMVGGRTQAGYEGQLFSDAPPNLSRTGHLPFDDALALFDESSVFVNTSVREGFPNTYIQAWLRGVPTVCLDADPDGIIAREGLGGVASDVPGLREVVVGLLGSPERYRSASLAAKTLARQRYTIGRVVESMMPALFGEAGDGRVSRQRAPSGRLPATALLRNGGR